MTRFVSGWIKTYRDLLHKDLNSNSTLWHIWTNLLLMATYKETQIVFRGKRITLPPGSVVFANREFARQFRCSEKTIRKWLNYLHNTERIALTTSAQGSIARILNWSRYQGDIDIEVTHQLIDGRQGVAPSTQRARTEDAQGTHEVPLNEEYKKEEYKYNACMGAPQQESEDLTLGIADEVPNSETKPKKVSRERKKKPSFDFEAVWAIYPNPEDISKARKRFEEVIRTQQDYDDLLEAVRLYSERMIREKKEPGFIKKLVNFIGDKKAPSFRDEFELAKRSTASFDGKRPFVVPRNANSDISAPELFPTKQPNDTKGETT